MARHRHKIRQKHRLFPRRRTNQMHRSLGKYLVTTLSRYIKEKPLHSPENFAVVAGKNFQMTLVTLFLAEDEVFLLFRGVLPLMQYLDGLLPLMACPQKFCSTCLLPVAILVAYLVDGGVYTGVLLMDSMYLYTGH